jgi:hypothetical protein
MSRNSFLKHDSKHYNKLQAHTIRGYYKMSEELDGPVVSALRRAIKEVSNVGQS